jgi:hypothetical protein
MQIVLEALRAARRRLTTDEIIVATALDAVVVDRALQALLFRREVVCGSYQPPGRRGQTARLIGSPCTPLWSAADE